MSFQLIPLVAALTLTLIGCETITVCYTFRLTNGCTLAIFLPTGISLLAFTSIGSHTDGMIATALFTNGLTKLGVLIPGCKTGLTLANLWLLTVGVFAAYILQTLRQTFGIVAVELVTHQTLTNILKKT